MISSFNGQWRWLSNFWPCELVAKDGTVFHSVEVAYQWAKFSDPNLKRKLISCTPAQAKKLAGTWKRMIRDDWFRIRVSVMRSLLVQKFSEQNPNLRDWLISTGTEELIEGNAWGDTFWGQCPIGVGQNMLGKLLMEIRKALLLTQEKEK